MSLLLHLYWLIPVISEYIPPLDCLTSPIPFEFYLLISSNFMIVQMSDQKYQDAPPKQIGVVSDHYLGKNISER